MLSISSLHLPSSQTLRHLFFATAFSCSTLLAAPLVKDGESVAFLGDSITYIGSQGPGGYVRLVESGLKANGITITVIPAGIGGNTSEDMLARLGKDILSKHPAWMLLSCGVNDVNRRVNPIPLDAYQKNITAIVDQAQAAGIKVMIFTATLIGEDVDHPRTRNLKAGPYNDFLRQLAKDRHLPLADLNQDMRKALQVRKDAGSTRTLELTKDGVHMNYAGNLLMAHGVLRTFGLNDAELAKAEATWATIPDFVPLTVSANVTLAENALLEKRAGGPNLDQYLNEHFAAFLKAELAAARAEKANLR